MVRPLTCLLLLLASVSVGAAQGGPGTPAPVGTRWVALGPGHHGIAICAGGAVMAFIRHELSEQRELIVEAHEDSHLADMRGEVQRLGSCEAFNALWETSLEYRVRSESRAFCKSARKAVELFRDPDLTTAVWNEAAYLKDYFGLTQYDAASLIRSNGCG